MTRRPFRPDEVDMLGEELDSTIADLERYLADSADDPPSGFSDLVMTRVAGEPAPRRGVLAAVNSAFTSERGRIALLAATVAVAILAVVAAGQLSRLMPSQFGSSPSPSVSAPSVLPTAPATVQPSPSQSAEPSAMPTDDEESESPDASDDDDGTSRPSGSPEESDNSGPGGGGGDDSGNSGPGGGGGDDSGNSGPGGGSASPEADD
jgi:uncharacterized membrane protein YgcG